MLGGIRSPVNFSRHGMDSFSTTQPRDMEDPQRLHLGSSWAWENGAPWKEARGGCFLKCTQGLYCYDCRSVSWKLDKPWKAVGVKYVSQRKTWSVCDVCSGPRQASSSASATVDVGSTTTASFSWNVCSVLSLIKMPVFAFSLLVFPPLKVLLNYHLKF